MSEEIDPLDVESVSERELNERLQELEEEPYLNQEQSNEADCIEDELYRRASEDRKKGAEIG